MADKRAHDERRLAALSDKLASLQFPPPSRLQDSDDRVRGENDISAREESLSNMAMADPESARHLHRVTERRG